MRISPSDRLQSDCDAPYTACSRGIIVHVAATQAMFLMFLGLCTWPGTLGASSHYDSVRATLECIVVHSTDPARTTQRAILGIHESKRWKGTLLKSLGIDFIVLDGTTGGEIAAPDLIFDDSRVDQLLFEHEREYRTSSFHQHAPDPKIGYAYRFNVKVDRVTLRATRLFDEHRIEYACDVVDTSRYLRALNLYEKEDADRAAERQRQREAVLRERKI